jgi:hypothetical protein
MTRYLFLLILASVFMNNTFGQIFNRPVPEGFPNYEFRKPGVSSSDGHFLMTPVFPSPESLIRHMCIVDDAGYLAWFAGDGTAVRTNFEYHSGYGLFSFANPSNTIKFFLMDEMMEVIDSVLPANNYLTDIHEFRILENGNYLITGTTITSEDLSGYIFNGVSGGISTPVRSLVIQEFEEGDLIFDWKSIDHIHPEAFIDGYNFDSNNFDYVHGNAVEEDSEGNFLVSMRHTDAIYKIDRSTGEVIWVLGGSFNQFDFTNDDGFSGQHDVRVLANGNITLFDNGNNRIAPRFSRVVEYEMNYLDYTATRVWEYTDEYNSYSRAMGSFRVSEDGERIIGFGFCNRPASNFIHLDEQDEIISELLFQDTVVSYRALRSEFDFELNRPVISCSNVNNQVILTAPSGHTSYKWSTGEETQQISVSAPGTYQVWANKGIGMIGSEPFFLTDPTNPCGFVSNDMVENDGEQLIISKSNTGIFEVQTTGQVTVLNSLGQTVLEIMSTGSSNIDISNQPEGLYFIVLKRENSKRLTKRFVKF